MKKKLFLALVAVVTLFSLVLAGCSASGVPQTDYENLAAQLAAAQSQLAQAQDDLTALQNQKSAVDADLQAAQALVADLQQQVADLTAQYEYTGLSNAEIAVKIVENYAATHLYEKDIYDCNNMASDVWNMLKARGINAVIVVGSVQFQITSILQSDHAWVRAEVAPGEYLALDPTIGKAFTSTTDPRYFSGWYFVDPANLKMNDDLRTEYNTRVSFVNLLVAEINNAMTLYNNSSTPAEADKWLTLYNKLVEIKTTQESLLTTLMNQINQIATEL